MFIQESSRLSNDLSLILLLSLVPLHADHLLQLRESKTSERLGEDVHELPTSFDELDDDLPFIDTVTTRNSNISVCAKTHGKIRISTEKYFSDGVPSENNTQKENDRKIEFFYGFTAETIFLWVSHAQKNYVRPD